MCKYVYNRGDYNMGTKNITLKVNSELYDKYREHCKKEGWVISRQFEKLMESHLLDNEEGGDNV